MSHVLCWIAVNALLVSTHIVGAATSWAYGTLLLEFAPEVAGEWWAWFAVGAVALGAAIAFLLWVVGFAQRGYGHA
jgi:hypothetical protein